MFRLDYPIANKLCIETCKDAVLYIFRLDGFSDFCSDSDQSRQKAEKNVSQLANFFVVRSTDEIARLRRKASVLMRSWVPFPQSRAPYPYAGYNPYAGYDQTGTP